MTRVTEKDFQQGFVTNAEQLIANKIPGVQITPISGQPGAGSSFLIRGASVFLAPFRFFFLAVSFSFFSSLGAGLFM